MKGTFIFDPCEAKEEAWFHYFQFPNFHLIFSWQFSYTFQKRNLGLGFQFLQAKCEDDTVGLKHGTSGKQLNELEKRCDINL